MTSLARLVEDISGIPLGPLHAVTGRDAHNWTGTEIVVQELKVEPLLHWAYEPTLVGGTKGWLVNRHSGMWTLQDKLDQLGITVPREEMHRLHHAIVEEMTVRRARLDDSVIRELAARFSSPPR
jgi:isopropylmalate/homocitrate/citramalate synthase